VGGERLERLGQVSGWRSTGGLVRLGHKRVVSDDAALTAEPLLLEQEEGAELDEVGEAVARHVGHGMLETGVEAAEDVVDELAILDA
jgi:hypothetical protein